MRERRRVQRLGERVRRTARPRGRQRAERAELRAHHAAQPRRQRLSAACLRRLQRHEQLRQRLTGGELPCIHTHHRYGGSAARWAHPVDAPFKTLTRQLFSASLSLLPKRQRLQSASTRYRMASPRPLLSLTVRVAR